MKSVCLFAVLCLAATSVGAKDWDAERPAPVKTVKYLQNEDVTVVRLNGVVLKQPLFDKEGATLTIVGFTISYVCPGHKSACASPIAGLNIRLDSLMRHDFLLSPASTDVHFRTAGKTVRLSGSFEWRAGKADTESAALGKQVELLETILPLSELKRLFASESVRVYIGPYWSDFDSVAMKRIKSFLTAANAGHTGPAAKSSPDTRGTVIEPWPLKDGPTNSGANWETSLRQRDDGGRIIEFSTPSVTSSKSLLSFLCFPEDKAQKVSPLFVFAFDNVNTSPSNNSAKVSLRLDEVPATEHTARLLAKPHKDDPTIPLLLPADIIPAVIRSRTAEVAFTTVSGKRVSYKFNVGGIDLAKVDAMCRF